MNNIQRTKGFYHKWESAPFKNTITPDNYFEFRKWQEKAFTDLKDEQYRVINAPTGSGKSFVICGTILNDLIKNPSMKAIIAVPQKVIAGGFLEHYIQYPNGNKEGFFISQRYNLLHDTADNCSKKLKAFLDVDISGKELLHKRIMLCSHATLCRVFETKDDTKKLHNVSLCIDEAHHVRMDDDSIVDMGNKLGNILDLVIEEGSNIITLTTATFFRGDKISILHDKVENKFSRFNLPYDKYLPMMTHLKSFSYDFLLYKRNPIEILEKLYEEDFKNGRFKKGIIYLPSVNGLNTWDDKTKEVDDIKNIFGTNWEEDKNGIESITYMGKKISLVDLVDDGPKRKSRLNFIMKHSSSSKGPDLIIALGMFKEGANYEPLNHQVILGTRNSLTEVIQIIGRLLRDSKGKEHVSIYHCIPFCIDPNDGNTLKDSINNYLKVIYASLILESVMKPKPLPSNDDTNPAEPSDFDPEDWGDSEPKDYENIPIEVIDEIFKEMIEIQVHKNKIDYDIDYVPMVTKILESHDITTSERNIKYVWKAMVRRTIAIKQMGICVEDIPFDAVKDINPLGWVEGYFSGAVEGFTLQKFREAVNSLKANAEANMRELLEYHKKPSENSENKDEKKLYKRLSHYKQGKQGKGSTIWHDFFDDMIKEAGKEDWFEPDNKEEKASENMQELLNYHKKPSAFSKDHTEKKLARRLSSYKRGKQEKGKNIWYDFFDDMIKEAGKEDWFDYKQERAMKNMQELLEYHKKPSENSKDSKEKKLARRLSTYRGIGNKNGNTWYDFFDDMIKEAGKEEWFYTVEETAMKNMQELLNYHKKPSESSKDPKEIKLSIRLYSYKQTKQGKRSIWYDFFDDMIKEARKEDWFEPDKKEERAKENMLELLQYPKKPSGSSKDPNEKKLGKRLYSYKCAKQDKKGGMIWYDFFDDMIKEAGKEDWFEPRKRK